MMTGSFISQERIDLKRIVNREAEERQSRYDLPGSATDRNQLKKRTSCRWKDTGARPVSS
jgi:hypothetical protein